ncbi:hypothetical protein CBW21_15990 [Chromobacterium violaceum]|uniref:Carrier domain-containing protein n=2 Tax=Chromobacterium violaceum TaxID=536 RepID=A0A202B702_CHRVL|nr:hypothetical protein CBW21_15990 [Chromobacterium violaceum]
MAVRSCNRKWACWFASSLESCPFDKGSIMLNETQIFDELKALILDMKEIEEDQVQLSSSFEALELDSLDFVEVQVSVKKRYGVDLVSDLFASGKIADMGQLVGYIAAESAQKNTAEA